MTLREFLLRVANAQRANPRWRYGQTVFNTFLDTHPEYAEELRGSEQDPFYHDSRALPAIMQAEERGLLSEE